MKIIIIGILLFMGLTGFAQQDKKISTMEFVQVLDNQIEEAKFYFQNNWKVLRNKAIEKGYIHSYQLLETPVSDNEQFHIILMTTYLNEDQYNNREANFSELIEEKGGLKLMNDKKPSQFRKSLFSKDRVRHW